MGSICGGVSDERYVKEYARGTWYHRYDCEDVLYFADINGSGFDQPLIKVTRNSITVVPSN